MGQTIEIDAPAGRAEAYLTGAAGTPGVLFHIDVIGLRPRIEEMADRIAGWGYTVLAPNAFYRLGRGPGRARTWPDRRDGLLHGGAARRTHRLPAPRGRGRLRRLPRRRPGLGR